MNPYQQLPENAFWRAAVAGKSPFDISGMWKPKFVISPRFKLVTFGSCFAQHLSKAMVAAGFHWLNAEPAPPSANPAVAKEYNYGVFSARTGNIYTTTLLLQWVQWAIGETDVPNEYWESQGRFFDPFRPNIEPDGFASIDELQRSRRHTIECFRRCLVDARYFVFTLGLTESWRNREYGFEYPMCPGTVAGTFDAERHEFVNLDYSSVKRSLTKALQILKELNPKVRVLLTVSPVPLTATNSGQHVLTATTYSKSVLRAVAGDLAAKSQFIDYFPSFEIINAAPFQGMFFEPNKRSVNPAGVEFVMRSFFSCLGASNSDQNETALQKANTQEAEDAVCEEELLNAFGGA